MAVNVKLAAPAPLPGADPLPVEILKIWVRVLGSDVDFLGQFKRARPEIVRLSNIFDEGSCCVHFINFARGYRGQQKRGLCGCLGGAGCCSPRHRPVGDYLNFNGGSQARGGEG